MHLVLISALVHEGHSGAGHYTASLTQQSNPMLTANYLCTFHYSHWNLEGLLL